ncbi:MAG TPA: hypothetical protein VF746_12985 [Longimicrobium sp.]|jgi:hypothetical protein
MKKLRLELDDLEVASFEPDAGADGRGTAHAHEEQCSGGYTCGIDSREPKDGYEQIRTRYCCV